MSMLHSIQSRYLVMLLFAFAYTPDVFALSGKNSNFSTTSFFPRPQYRQLIKFFPKYSNSLSKKSSTVCAQTHQHYQIAYSAPWSSPEGRRLLSIYYQHEECMLDAIASDIAANFNSATVVLGLMPTLLVTIGPSIVEMAGLSSYRPLLGFLIALGEPAIWPTGLLE